MQPSVKAAVYLIQNSPYDLQANSLEQSGKYWLSCSNYVAGLDLGVSGQLGGNNAEFEESFYNQFQYYPRGVDAVSFLINHLNFMSVVFIFDPLQVGSISVNGILLCSEPNRND